MKIAASTIICLAFAWHANAQVDNRTQVYVNPNTEVYVVGDFANATGGSSFTVNEGGLLYVGGDLNNVGTMTFENDASLLRGDNSVDGGGGTYTVKRQATNNGYNYFSAPIHNHNGIPGTHTWLYDETESTQYPDDDQDPDPGWFPYSGIMNPGEGYAGNNVNMATFTGNRLNNGDVSIGLNSHPYDPASSDEGTPFNLVGNPFPSGLNLTAFLDDNTNVFGAIYLWSDDGTGGTGYSSADYSVWNYTGGVPTNGVNGAPTPNGFIKTGQAFMLRNLTAATLEFNNSHRVSNTMANAFYRVNADESKLWLSINGPDESYFNQILVACLEDATNTEDRLYDAVKIQVVNGTSLSAQAHGYNYAILAFPPPLYSQMVPLSLVVESDEDYYFRADQMTGFNGMDVYLVDSENNSYTLLEQGLEVPVSLQAGVYNDRFFLNYAPSSLVGIDDGLDSELNAWSTDGTVFIQASGRREHNAVAMELYDLQGKLVAARENLNLSKETTIIPIKSVATGTYILRLSSSDINLSKQLYFE